MDKLVEKSCSSFLEQLASKAPVPGGGGVAAIVGAIGSALCSMAGNLTIGRKKYAAVEEDVKRMVKRADELRLRLLELVDEDAKMFEPLSKAYSIPKDDPNREATMQQVSIDACKAPMEMMRLICESVDLLEEMKEKGSALLVSDVGCGALCARAALECAAMNVFINTKSLKREVVQGMEDEADKMLREYCPKAERIAESVLHGLRA